MIRFPLHLSLRGILPALAVVLVVFIGISLVDSILPLPALDDLGTQQFAFDGDGDTEPDDPESLVIATYLSGFSRYRNRPDLDLRPQSTSRLRQPPDTPPPISA